jgi:Fibronectin type III domain/Concanavalin A-like lectin/glucanases superfamily
MRNRTATLLAILISVVSTTVVCAREQTIVLGVEDGWGPDANLNRLIRVRGRYGSEDLEIMPFRHETDADTELLLHFDSLPLSDESGHFVVSAGSPELSSTTNRAGIASLLVDDPSDRVDLFPVGAELFQPGVEWGSFTLEFWLYPVSLTEGDRILEWTGREGARLQFRDQQFRIDIHNRRLRFSLVNFFSPPDESAHSVVLEGDSGLIPRRWSHHMLRFSDETALLEYLVDGRTVAVAHVSESGSEDGSVFFPRTASYPSESIKIASSFTGAIDEFRMVRRFEVESETPRFHPGGGVYESGVIDLGSPGARLTGISAITDTPAMSDVFVYYRMANTRSGTAGIDADWTPVRADEPVPVRMGRFVQLRAELLPDSRVSASPVLSEIRITYIPDPPPNPPVGLEAIPHDGWVELSWLPVLQEDIQGYLVYYGMQPGRYFGSDGDLGPSPIDVGPATSITLSGLENGRLYNFAVSAYDAGGIHSTTELSTEVGARPARVHR